MGCGGFSTLTSLQNYLANNPTACSTGPAVCAVLSHAGSVWNCLGISHWTPSSRWLVTWFLRTSDNLLARIKTAQVLVMVPVLLKITFLWPKWLLVPVQTTWIFCDTDWRLDWRGLLWAIGGVYSVGYTSWAASRDGLTTASVHKSWGTPSPVQRSPQTGLWRAHLGTWMRIFPHRPNQTQCMAPRAGICSFGVWRVGWVCDGFHWPVNRAIEMLCIQGFLTQQTERHSHSLLLLNRMSPANKQEETSSGQQSPSPVNVSPGAALLSPWEVGNTSGVKIVPAKSAAKPCSWTSCIAGVFFVLYLISQTRSKLYRRKRGLSLAISGYEIVNNIPPEPDLPLHGGNHKNRFPGQLSSYPHCQNGSNSRGAEEAPSPQQSSCLQSQPQDLPKSPLPSLLCPGSSLVTPFSVLFSG